GRRRTLDGCHPGDVRTAKEMLKAHAGKAGGGGPEAAAVDADAHRQTQALAANRDPAELPRGRLHSEGGRDRAQTMIIAAEEEEKGVAAEFEVRAAPFESDVEHTLEVAVDNRGEELGALAARTGQFLRDCREAGDVCEEETAIQGLDTGGL